MNSASRSVSVGRKVKDRGLAVDDDVREGREDRDQRVGHDPPAGEEPSLGDARAQPAA